MAKLSTKFRKRQLVLHLLLLLHLWKTRKFDSFSCLEEMPVLARNPEPPKNPSNLSQNRFKCLRRTFNHRGKNLRSTVP